MRKAEVNSIDAEYLLPKNCLTFVRVQCLLRCNYVQFPSYLLSLLSIFMKPFPLVDLRACNKCAQCIVLRKYC